MKKAVELFKIGLRKKSFSRWCFELYDSIFDWTRIHRGGDRNEDPFSLSLLRPIAIAGPDLQCCQALDSLAQHPILSIVDLLRPTCVPGDANLGAFERKTPCCQKKKCHQAWTGLNPRPLRHIRAFNV